MKSIQIGDRLVGEGYPCYFIAEAGLNHNGLLQNQGVARYTTHAKGGEEAVREVAASILEARQHQPGRWT